ncbi:MAG: hypothetical protein ABI910_06625, partial [Gemmatimonadota bacterium]
MHEAQIAPPSPPSPPQLPVITDAPAVELIQPPAVAGTNASPSDVLQAYQAQRDELRSQLNSLTSERYSIARRLREGEVSGVDKAGLESRMQALDTRILDVSKSVAAADLRVATQKGVPGANVPPPFSEQGPPR